MWENLLGRIPSGLAITCAILAGAVPYIFFRVIQKLHQAGDPTWKKNG